MTIDYKNNQPLIDGLKFKVNFFKSTRECFLDIWNLTKNSLAIKNITKG